MSQGSEKRTGPPKIKEASKRTKTSPQLSAALQEDGNEEGYCGNFARVRRWKITHPVAGVIVQHVTRTFDVSRATNAETPLTGAELDNYVKGSGSSVYATDTDYWELWTVSPQGIISDGGNDTFGLCSLISWDGMVSLNANKHVKGSTKGSFVISGEAYFYANENPTQFATKYGFVRKAVACAGGLYSRTGTPNLPEAESGPVHFSVTVTWNSSSPAGYYSKVQYG